MHWDDDFISLFQRISKAHENGSFHFDRGYSEEELSYLKSIGYKKREFFDFVEDFVADGEPSISTSLLVAAVRRDYFLTIQKGEWSPSIITKNDLPSFGDELDGIKYLPRILVKARGKLHGELDPDIMYGCGGDRNFLMKHGNIHLADFLRQVWASEGDDLRVAAWIHSL